MNNPKQILGIDLNSIPPKNYLWLKEDGIYTYTNGGKKTKVSEKVEGIEESLGESADPKQILWGDLNSVPPRNYLWNRKDGIYKWFGDSWKKYWTLKDVDGEEEEENPYAKMPFTAEFIVGGRVGCITKGNPVEYSINGGEWTSEFDNSTFVVEDGDVVQFRGTGSSYAQGNGFTFLHDERRTGIRFNLKGNIMSLIAGEDFENADGSELGAGAFNSMFYNSESVVDVSNLVLPATVLPQSCYNSMFYQCPNLVDASFELPATTLSKYCYTNMFQGCTNLVHGPKFTIEIPGDTCCNKMFYGCSNLEDVNVKFAPTVISSCYLSMFEGCTNLVMSPELPATALTGAYSCYYQMFKGCSKINRVKAMFISVDPHPSSFMYGGLTGTAANGVLIRNPEAVGDPTNEFIVPSGGTVQSA